MQRYSDPARESDPYALPDIETWQDRIAVYFCPDCGEHDIRLPAAFFAPCCPHCLGQLVLAAPPGIVALPSWWGWYCFPGCMPEGDGQPTGPYLTEEEVLSDLRGE